MPARPGRDKRLYLIDGMPLVYRAYFVFLNNPLITANGFNSSAVFGYTTSLLQILTDEEPTHVAVVFDAPGPTWRTEEYADYKGTRAKAPEGVRDSLPHVQRMTEAMGIPIISHAGVEADDVIGTIARRAEAAGLRHLHGHARQGLRAARQRSPEHVEWCTQIRALPRKKAAPKPISYLEKSEIDALLDAPSRATRQGHRDRALLLFLYNTGVRASEAAQLTVGDLQLTVPESHPSLATVHGKGGKVRQCPLWPRTARLLAALVEGRPCRGAGSSATGTDNRSPASASDAWSVATRPSPPPVRRRSSASASVRM